MSPKHPWRPPQVKVFRPDRPGVRKVLGDLEAEIMEIVWARPRSQGTAVRDIVEILQQRRPVAYTTIMTTMARLARKRLLRAEKRGQAYIYFPTMAEDEFVSGFVAGILDNLLLSFSGATIERLKALADPRASTRARRLLARIARQRAAKEK
jgi:predicted transcriptional regulator